MRAICPVNLILLDLITLIFYEAYKRVNFCPIIFAEPLMYVGVSPRFRERLVGTITQGTTFGPSRVVGDEIIFSG
jgi:hypothetical protein